MELVPEREEARIHRAVYADIVSSALKGWATNREFAAHIGRTREYLQYLLREGGLRTPGPETAERIVKALPLAAEQRQDLLEHMLLAAAHRLKVHRAARNWVSEAMSSDTVERLREAHWEATYAADPLQAKRNYQFLRDLATAFLDQRGLRQQPLIFVETSLLLHDAQSVLDRPGHALFHARLAAEVMRHLDSGDYRRGRERFYHLRVNTVYAEAVTLTTLGLARQAENSLGDAERFLASDSTAGTFWAPHIYRHQLAALSGKLRFSLYQAKELAHRAKSACQERDDPLDPQVSLLIDVSLARAYLRYGSDLSIRTAARLLRPSVEFLESIPYVGPVHQVVTMRTFARACRAGNLLDEWNHYARKALETAEAAGLHHQVRMIWQENAEALGPARPAAPPVQNLGVSA